MPPPRPDLRRIRPYILVTANAFPALVALAVLMGIWFGKPGADKARRIGTVDRRARCTINSPSHDGGNDGAEFEIECEGRTG